MGFSRSRAPRRLCYSNHGVGVEREGEEGDEKKGTGFQAVNNVQLVHKKI